MIEKDLFDDQYEKLLGICDKNNLVADFSASQYCETFRAKELNVMRPPKDGRALKEVLAWSAKGYGLIPLPTETQ